MKKMGYQEKLPRTCYDLKVKNSRRPSGHYTVDPNMGSAKDAIKSYCDFEGKVAKTCVKNTTSDSQIGFLHMLHSSSSQSINLPCGAQGPFRLQPYDNDYEVDVAVKSGDMLDVSVSGCSPFSMLREIEFSSSGSMLPFTQPIHISYSEYHFNDVCFY